MNIRCCQFPSGADFRSDGVPHYLLTWPLSTSFYLLLLVVCSFQSTYYLHENHDINGAKQNSELAVHFQGVKGGDLDPKHTFSRAGQQAESLNFQGRTDFVPQMLRGKADLSHNPSEQSGVKNRQFMCTVFANGLLAQFGAFG